VVLVTVVGMLIEVPVMLSVVKIVDRTRVWYERKSGSRPTPSAARFRLHHPAVDTFRGSTALMRANPWILRGLRQAMLSCNCHNALA
jgi:hypothetical protein